MFVSFSVSVYTSGFVDDVMLSYGCVTLPQQPGCNVVHGLTPMQSSISFVRSYTTAEAPRLDESFVEWVSGGGGRSVVCTSPCF